MRRAVACVFTLALVRCTTYGAAPDVAAPERDASTNDDSSSAPNGDGSVGGDGSANDDASSSLDGNVSGDGAPGCALFELGDTCSASSQCCSNKCNEKRVCANSCSGAGSFNCDPASTDDCCVGLWCNTGSCSACIPGGQQAATQSATGAPIAHSCCSRALKALTSTCQ